MHRGKFKINNKAKATTGEFVGYISVRRNRVMSNHILCIVIRLISYPAIARMMSYTRQVQSTHSESNLLQAIALTN